MVDGGRIFRLVRESGLADSEAAITSPAVNRLLKSGQLAGTAVLDPAAIQTLRAQGPWSNLLDEQKAVRVLEHEVVPFPTFPYEWPAQMLHAAATLTLDMAEALLPEGLGLKDATPYNILFRGCHPVWVDFLSIVRRRADDPIWRPNAQFVRTFLLPLAACKHLRIPVDQVFVTRRDGLEPDEVYRWCGWWKRLRPPLLGLVSIPVWLSPSGEAAGTSLYREESTGDPAKAQFILSSLLRRLRRTLRRLTPNKEASSWSGYGDHACTYSAEEQQAKRVFVEQALREFRPKRVLDVGCNTGVYSELAASAGAATVSIDSDPVVVGELFRKAAAGGLDVLPLAVNIARPSPGLGWNNQETPSFLERARGHFDAVLMLALLHHLILSDGIPMEKTASLASELTTDLLFVEFIGTEDPAFQRLLRGREALFAGVTRERFEAVFGCWFHTLRSQQVHRHRILYLMRRGAAS